MMNRTYPFVEEGWLRSIFHHQARMKFGILALVYWRGFFMGGADVFADWPEDGREALPAGGGGAIAAHKCRCSWPTERACGLLLQISRMTRVVAGGRGKKSSPLMMRSILPEFPCHCSTSDSGVNQRIVQDSRAANLPTLCVDSPEDCDWIMPATIRRGDFTVSFGTDGVFPDLAARVKRDSMAIFGEDLGRLCEEARLLRERAQQVRSDRQQRKPRFAILRFSRRILVSGGSARLCNERF